MSIEIVSRGDWGAKQPGGPQPWRKIVTPTPEVFIHHTVTPTGPDPAAILRGFQQSHINRAKQNGWQTWDIAYNWIISPEDKRIYEGRGWGFYGNHTQNHNDKAHSISFLGNYQTSSPTAWSLDAARWLIHEGRRQGHIVRAGALPTGGHRDVWATACPGSRLYDRMDYLRQPWKEEMTPEQMQELKAYIDGKINGPTGAVAQIKNLLESHSGASGTGLTAAQVKEAAKQAAREGTGA